VRKALILFCDSGLIICAIGLSTILAVRASAETMEGDHLVLIGIGRMGTSTRLTGVQPSYDFDGDGIPDNFAQDNQATHGESTSLQYYYHWSPSWAFGISAEQTTMRGSGSWAYHSYNLSSGQMLDFSGSVSAKAISTEFLPTVRYTMLTHRRINPYLVGGLGLNHFSVSNSIAYAESPMLGSPSTFSGSLNGHTSTGLAATLGAGVQGTIVDHLLVGIEGRWTYCQIDQNAFGTSSWNRFEGSLWIGTKWNAPL
jgi:opacity protein-like surface antigen